MTNYTCSYGQSGSDVVLNTYGTMDLYVKFLTDNNLTPNWQPQSGQVVVWDPTLVNNEGTQQLTNQNGTVYSTFTGVAEEGNVAPPNPDDYMYVQANNTSYTATSDGETVITIDALQGADIPLLQVTKEIKQLLPSQFTFDPVAGTITLLGGLSLAIGETLFVLYNTNVG